MTAVSTTSKFFTIALLTGTFGVSLSFWIVFRVIFSRITQLSDSPVQSSVSIIAPVILFAIFVWLLTLVILYIKQWRLRLLLYFSVALSYAIVHFSFPVNTIYLLGIIATLLLYDYSYRAELSNQKKEMRGKTVLTAGILPITIFSITLSWFYFPIYSKNVSSTLHLRNHMLTEKITSLGYFFALQVFLIVSTGISAILVFLSSRYFKKF